MVKLQFSYINIRYSRNFLVLLHVVFGVATSRRLSEICRLDSTRQLLAADGACQRFTGFQRVLVVGRISWGTVFGAFCTAIFRGQAFCPGGYGLNSCNNDNGSGV